MKQEEPIDLVLFYKAYNDKNIDVQNFKIISLAILEKSFRWKKKKFEFTCAIDSARTKDKLVQLVTNYTLSGQGFKVL